MGKLCIYRTALLADGSTPRPWMWTIQSFPSADETRSQTHSMHASSEAEGIQVEVNVHFHDTDVILKETVIIVLNDHASPDATPTILEELQAALHASDNAIQTEFNSFSDTVDAYLLKLPRMLRSVQKFRECKVRGNFSIVMPMERDLDSALTNPNGEGLSEVASQIVVQPDDPDCTEAQCDDIRKIVMRELVPEFWALQHEVDRVG